VANICRREREVAKPAKVGQLRVRLYDRTVHLQQGSFQKIKFRIEMLILSSMPMLQQTL
jgi:hypothetical protein